MHDVFLLQTDLGVSSLPHAAFDAIHLTLLLVVGYFAYRAYAAGARLFALAFLLFVLGEVSYIGYHVGATTFLLSHTVSEVLVFLAFVSTYVAAQGAGVLSRADRPRPSTDEAA